MKLKLKGLLRKKLEMLRKKEVAYPKVFIKEPKCLILLPSFKRKTKVKVKYPLLEPLASANIYWDDKRKGIVYEVLEPKLSSKERELLDKIKAELTEVIEIELSAIKKKYKAMDYLEKITKKVLEDSRIALTPTLYVKLMYYIFRDFIGLNEIEPIMHDPYIEDVACDGLNVPIYLVHRKFGSIETNIIYRDAARLSDFVIKLAERCGRYVSYAKPLLDGALPDGSRIQATLAKDITTHGPTFSIRKFRKSPISPIEMMNLGTASAELMAYLWLIAQSSASAIVCGGVATGKTTFLNTMTMFLPPDAKIVSIEDSVLGNTELLYKRSGKIYKTTIAELIDTRTRNKEKVENKENIEIFGLDKNGKIQLFKPSAFIRHKVKKKVLDIQLASGRQISVTADHSLFSLNDEGKVIPMPGHELKVGSFLATPRVLPYAGKKVIFKLTKHLDKLDCFVEGNGIKTFINKNHTKLKRFLSKSGIKWCKNKQFIKAEFFKKLGGKLNKKMYLRSRYGTLLPTKIEIDNELATFVGLWLADGCYDKNSVIISVDGEEGRKVMRKIATRYHIKCKMHSDNVSLMLNSKLFKEFCENILNLKGNAYTKRLPKWTFSLPDHELASLLRGYFSGDGWVRKDDVAIRSSSLGLLKDVQTALLRFKIQFRISSHRLKDATYEARISGRNLSYFLKIGFLQRYKKEKLTQLQNRNFHDVSDIIPLPKHFYKVIKPFLRQEIGTVRTYWSWKSWDRNYVGKQNSNIGRSTLQQIVRKIPNNPHGILHQLASNDIFWDKITSIKEREYEGYVYDLSIPEVENFICENIIAHNTRELNLPHENWIPSVTRIGFGIPGPGGRRYGEVTLFDLLKESFRQNPDHVVVGEVRGKEAYVMFQGMASGNPSFGTIHAGSIDDVIKRLETPPMELSPSLVETLDLLVVMAKAKERGESARRVKEVVEIQSVDIHTGKAHVLRVFQWIPFTDEFESNLADSKVLRKISYERGISPPKIMEELKNRKSVLEWMQRHDVTRYDEVCKLINLYYKDPAGVLEWVRKDIPPYKVRAKIGKVWESVTGLKLIRK